MRGMDGTAGAAGEDCPFAFNFDAATFAVGDTVSYRVSSMDDWPFVGTLIEVHPDRVVISPGPAEPAARYVGTRESRPMVDGSQI